MINRNNYHLVYKHLDYRRHVMQNDEGTIATYWQSLKHLLQWADSKSFKDAPKLIPTFPEYLLTARNDGKNKRLTPKYMDKVLSHVRTFFDWARLNQPGFGIITEAWITTIKVRKSAGMHSRLQERQYWKLEDVRKIASLNPSGLREQRDIAATCFLYISAMRIGAFVTLPVECVDMNQLRVEQLPEKGVHTKNSKAAITFLLPMPQAPELLEIVRSWDAFVKREGVSNWYPALDQATKTTLVKKRFSGIYRKDYQGRTYAYTEGLRYLCDRAGVPFKSPHKLRHGFGVYAIKHAKNVAQLKAVSQNMMHANIGITDGIYGKLAEDDLAEILSSFGK